MRFLRRFSLLVLTAVGSAVLAGPAFGARPTPVELPFTLGTAHFLVHYQSDLINFPDYAITQTQAGDIAALAERAYTAELADGYPAPPSDGALGGDARTDVYVTKLAGPIAVTVPDNPGGATSSSYIELDGTKPDLAFTQHVLAHELFHTIQLGIWLPAQASDYWLLEGSAEWMGYRADNYDTSFSGGTDLGPSDMSLDCRDPLGTNMCDLTDDYKNGGYSRWPFFEYVTEKYGPSFIQDVFNLGAGGAGSAIAAVSAEFTAKGTTLADAYDAWTQADLTGAYSVAGLQQSSPTVYASLQTGAKGGALGTILVPVNHLSTRTLAFIRGDGDPSHICYSATLALTVTMPAGTLSKPVFWWNAAGSAPVPLSINGNTATASIPWDTCSYSSTKGFLALPNASTAVDAADFSVKSTLTIDSTKPVTPVGPPDPVATTTPVIQVTAADVAPTLTLWGPEILQVSGKDTQLRLIVESNNQGSVKATLGTTVLGTVPIRAGNNDVRFKLPPGILRTVRRTAGANTLTLTPTSPNGTTIGQAVTRSINVLAPKAKRRTK